MEARFTVVTVITTIMVLFTCSCSSSSNETAEDDTVVADTGSMDTGRIEEDSTTTETADPEEIPTITELVSSQSYKGHENDADSNYFVTVHNNALGTRLDDCQTCHKGGLFTYQSGDKVKDSFKNSCDYCHLIIHPQEFNEPLPTSYEETLNPFGLAYKEAGRSIDALLAINDVDSDEDGFSNNEEIADLKYPGDPDSKPGQQVAPMKIYSTEDLKAMTVHSEFLLANSHKQEFDNYATYKGVTIKDLLAEAGVDTASDDFQGITVIAPDGYLKDFTKDDVLTQYPAGLFYDGLDISTLGPDCGFVEYPDQLPDGLVSGGEIADDQWLMIGYERDGMDMDPSTLDPTSGKMNGEGPYRIIVPQSDPGEPDRGSKYSPTECADGYDYDDSKNHNAGDMVRGVIAVRVNPLPEGVEDFDYKNGGWAYIEKFQLIVYGFGITGE
jgi:hypothetical protein